MGFYIHTIDSARTTPTEYLPAEKMTPKEGLLLCLSDGVLAVCSGANKPTYICMKQGDAEVEEGTVIPVVRILPDMVLETTASTALTSVKPGDRLCISEDGMEVAVASTASAASEGTQTEGSTSTASAAAGAAELIYKASDAAGSTVHVRIV